MVNGLVFYSLRFSACSVILFQGCNLKILSPSANKLAVQTFSRLLIICKTCFFSQLCYCYAVGCVSCNLHDKMNGHLKRTMSVVWKGLYKLLRALGPPTCTSSAGYTSFNATHCFVLLQAFQASVVWKDWYKLLRALESWFSNLYF